MTTTSSSGHLELRGIGKRYGKVSAVDDVSLRMEPGEFLTLLGASGSGKTTTLKIIAGFEEPDSGEVRLGDRAITRLPAHRRNIGVVFQNYALFPHLTAAQNIAFPLRVRGIGKAERDERVRDALATVRLEGMGDRYPRQLSGGQQQRVALARAIVFQPQVLLMDEPMGALDKKLREALQLEIMRIHRELGITICYVTHDQEEALVMSDRIAIYDHGRIRQVGTAEELYERPGSVFVAEFMGESNVFHGTFDGTGSVGRLVVPGRPPITVPAGGSHRPGNGASAAVVVRPERIRVQRKRTGEGSGPEPGHNVLAGVVQDVIYLGSDRRYLVELPGGGTHQARVGAAEADPGIGRGDHVELAWDRSDAILLEAPAAEREAAS
ncbi:ABC transporter ATP-binding protein [Actinomadura viridis]|uniref:Spermidine/putrescine import ATP-binding protein PotA n=1 Tax=Actinomadura viridis TaxID=58110 RepID=A0A931GG57_9ACTN|nr:ABC transporter ATP-binding protein [Actinomadura viridis]MBG6085985.1 putative spermidine/putrescine transport system ATP-binding protein [Actinomadura viridis]